jgi:hypothetical protein
MDHLGQQQAFASSLADSRGRVLNVGCKTRKPTDRPSVIHSGRSFFPVAPPVRGLDIVWVVISPCSTHPLRILVVWDNIVAIGEFLLADGADPVLFHNLPVQQSLSSLRVI